MRFNWHFLLEFIRGLAFGLYYYDDEEVLEGTGGQLLIVLELGVFRLQALKLLDEEG